MATRLATIAIATVLVAAGATLVCLRPPQPQAPMADTTPVYPRVAPPEVAISLARIPDSTGQPTILLVTALGDGYVEAIALAPHLDAPTGQPLEAYNRIGRDGLLALLATQTPTRTAIADLLPVFDADRHVAAGTNFEAHADEVDVDPVFLFPKISAPSPSAGDVPVPLGVLLDYEVEICLIADRPIDGPDALSDARIGVVLCSDLTDRAALLRGIDLDDPASGAGFATAKGGDLRLLTGPIVAVPADWRSFVAEERIETRVNGGLRQSDVGASMREDFDTLVARMAAEADRSFDFRGARVPMVDGRAIGPGQAILSGTPSGVIFRPPSRLEIGCGIAAYCLGGFLRERRPVAFVIERYIRRLDAAQLYLQPGDRLIHASARLGTIEWTLTTPGD